MASFENPITLPKGVNDPVAHLLTNLINLMLTIVGVLAVAAIVYGGLLYIISLGNEQRVGQAKKIIFWAIAGLVVIILARIIVPLVGEVLGV